MKRPLRPLALRPLRPLALRSLALRAGLLLAGGIGLGAAGAAASVLLGWGGGEAFAAATCTASGTTATIALDGTPTTISDSSGNLDVNGNATTPCSSTTFALAGATVTFSATVATDLTIDQAAGGDFPVNTAIDGTLDGGTLTVNANSQDNLTFGSTGFVLSSTSTVVDTLSAAQPYVVDAAAAPVTVSGAGSASPNTGSSTSSPVTLSAAPSGTNKSYTVDGNVSLQATSATGTYKVTANDDGDTNQVVGGAAAQTFDLLGDPVAMTGVGGGTYTLSALPTSTTVTAGAGTEVFDVTAKTTGVTYGGGSDPAGNDTFDLTSTAPYDTNTFLGGAGTDTFEVNGTTNNANRYTGGSGTDSITIDGNQNTFLAGSGTESFFDTGTGNVVDFANVGASSGAPLVVNVSGLSQPAGSSTLLSNGQATLTNSKVVYTFHDTSSVTTSNSFTTFDGAESGYTEFLASESGGLSFDGNGTGNTAAFFGSNGVVVNMSTTKTQGLTNVALGPSIPVASFSLAPGQVLVGSPTTTTCGAPAIAAYCDALTSVGTVTGPQAGYSTFYAGEGPGTFTASDAGDHNTFVGSTGQANFSSGGNSNTYVAGFGTETFTETTTSFSPTNQIDFANVPTGSSAACPSAPCSLLVNVSGSNTSINDYVAALYDSNHNQIATYTFGAGSGGPSFTSFIGGSGGDTTFEGGSIVGAPPSGYPTYEGQGSGNTLDFSEVSTGAALTLDVTKSPFPLATLGNAQDSFSGITNLVGLLGGNTTFEGGSSGGYAFTGNGTGNSADFSKDGTGVTVNLGTGGATTLVASLTATSGSFSGGTVTFDLGATPLCSAAVQANGTTATASCVTSIPLGGQAPTAVYTPPAGSPVVWTISPVSVTVGGGTVLVGTPSASTCGSAGALASFCDSLTNVSVVTGSAGGYNIFVAGSSAETFADNGGAGFDTIDFAGISAGNGSPLVVNVSGVGTSDYTATLGTTTYNFQTGGPGFTTFVGSLGGFTTFDAGGTGGYTFIGQGTSDSVNFSADSSPIIANLSGISWTSPTDATVTVGPNQVLLGSGSCPALCDGISGITTIVGSGTGSNRFIAGTSNEIFQGGMGNSVDFSNLTAPVVVNVSQAGQSPQSTSYGTATSGGFTYDFSNFVSSAISFVGSTGGTTFYAGSAADTFSGQGASGDALSFALAPGTSLSVDVLGGSGCPGGVAVLGTTSECFSGIKTFDGLANTDSTTTFVAGSQGGYTFHGVGGTNSVDFSQQGSGIDANLSTSPASGLGGTVSIGPGQVLVAAPTVGFNSCGPAGAPYPFCDSLSGISIVTGSDLGGNTFVAGPNSETFRDTGSSRTDAIDFSNVPAGSGAVLTVNVSGVGTSTYEATFGTITYDFTTGSIDFSSLTGSAGGFTDFLAGTTSGYTFKGQGASNTVDFSAASCAVDANFATGSATLPCSTSGPDTFTDITTVVGSSGGRNTFVAGAGGDEVFKGGTDDEVDFSGLTQPVVVNVSVPGETPQSTTFGTATSGGFVYDFTSFDTAPTTFVGSAAGTTFYAGPQPDSFTGNGTSTTLNFTESSGSSLLVCTVAWSASGCLQGGEAFLGTTTEQFSGITTFDGLSANGSSTTFVAGGAGGLNFDGEGGTNALDFSPQGGTSAGIVANLSNLPYSAGAPYVPVGFTFSVGPGQVLVGTGLPGLSCALQLSVCDTFSGVSQVTGSAGGYNTFVAGPASQTFADTGGAGHDTIDFSNLRTTTSANPLTINASGTSAGALGPYSASFGAITYSFGSDGADFSVFVGASSGNTRFQASGSAYGLTFRGEGSGNTADFSQSTATVVVNMVTDTVTFGGVAADADFLAGSIATVVGSQFYANTFYGDLSGTEMTSTSSTNTVSYADMSLPPGGGVRIDLSAGQVILYCVPGAPVGCPPVPNSFAPDTFSFPSGGILTVQGSPGDDDILAGGTQPVFLEGGGSHDVTVDLSRTPKAPDGTTGVNVNLQYGLISGPTIGQISFTAGCSGTDLCVQTVVGSPYDDTFTLTTALSPVSINGDAGTDELDLSQVPATSTITMPNAASKSQTCGTLPVLPSPTYACGSVSGGIDAYFTSISDVAGTEAGGDLVVVGTGAETLTDGGISGANPGTLDFSALSGQTSGITVSVQEVSGTPEGTLRSPTGVASGTFSGFATFDGTSSGQDTFEQTGAGTFAFNGGAGATNVLDLESAPAGLAIVFDSTVPACPGQSSGTTTVGGSVADHFSCISQVESSGTLTYGVSPGENVTISGGGSGTLELIAPAGGSLTAGTTVTLPATAGSNGTVDGGGFDFSFNGMSTIDGTGQGDLIIAGPGNFTIDETGGSNTLSFAGAPAGVVINDSGSTYTTPGGTTVARYSTSGGYGGTITMTGIANLIGTGSFDDTFVAGPGSSTLVGGSGSDRFVLTGGYDLVVGGSGPSTIDLSELAGPTALDLGTSAPQSLGPGDGDVTLVSGTVSTVVASNGGSQIWGGNGDLTIEGGPGSDWLAAGNGNQTLVGNGGSDTLVAGVGADTLEGGAQPVTFEPGQGSDTLTSLTTGNTLSYAGSPAPVDVNLSGNTVSIPAGEPFSGTILPGDTARGGPGATVNLGGAGITTVVGTPEGDVFVTGPAGDTFDGGGGGDLFVVTSDNNNLTASPGSAATFLFEDSGGSGTNVIDGGGRSTVDFSQLTTQVTVDLQGNSPYATEAGGSHEQLSGILDIVGSNLSDGTQTDVLIAGAPGATVTASPGGKAFLEAAPGGGDTLVYLGTSQATFCAEASCAFAGTAAGGPDTMVGGGGIDTFFARNGQVDTIIEQYPEPPDLLFTDPNDKVQVL